MNDIPGYPSIPQETPHSAATASPHAEAIALLQKGLAAYVEPIERYIADAQRQLLANVKALNELKEAESRLRALRCEPSKEFQMTRCRRYNRTLDPSRLIEQPPRGRQA